MFISHTGPDSGWLAAWLHRELTANGLNAFLDHSNGPQAGDLWPEMLWQAAWSCRVFIVLISPGFFLREWPVRELCIALERLRASPAAVTVVPVYCGWTRQQAAGALRAAASSADGRLHHQNADTGKVTQGTIWQPAAHQPRQQAAAQALAQTQTLNSLLQQLSNVQQPNAPRIFHEHYKLIEVETVAELVRAALRVVPRPDFEVPKGKLLTLWHTAHLRPPLLKTQLSKSVMLQALWAEMTSWQAWSATCVQLQVAVWGYGACAAWASRPWSKPCAGRCSASSLGAPACSASPIWTRQAWASTWRGCRNSSSRMPRACWVSVSRTVLP